MWMSAGESAHHKYVLLGLVLVCSASKRCGCIGYEQGWSVVKVDNKFMGGGGAVEELINVA